MAERVVTGGGNEWAHSELLGGKSATDGIKAGFLMGLS
jgi:hypothetical protein